MLKNQCLCKSLNNKKNLIFRAQNSLFFSLPYIFKRINQYIFFIRYYACLFQIESVSLSQKQDFMELIIHDFHSTSFNLSLIDLHLANENLDCICH